MNVILINCYQDKEITSRMAAMTCVGGEKISNNGFETAIKSGHYSILEHLPITWLIEGVSRSLTHQLVRHRIASYSELSQRYKKIDTDKSWYLKPENIRNNKNINALYDKLMNTVAAFYNESIVAGIPKEDARMVLPNACFSTILVTMNARSFIEAANKRLCRKAQWEIRELFEQMRESIKYAYPIIYKLAAPNCKANGCKETKSCGRKV